MGILDSLKSGIGKVGRGVQTTLGSALYPVSPEMTGLPPEQIAELRRASLGRLGLGMLAGENPGVGLVHSGNQFQNIIAQSYENTHQKQQEAKAEARQQADREHQLEREKAADARYAAEQAAEAEKLKTDQAWRKEQADRQERLARDQLAQQKEITRMRTEAGGPSLR